MPEPITPWSPYEGRNAIFSSGRKALTAAFGDLVQSRVGFPAYELAEIFAAPKDEGENDAARDLVRLDAEMMARAFASGRLACFARPLGGGEVQPIDADLWEVDEPLLRFATGALNLEQWADPDAPLTHRLFVDIEQFDSWLAALKPLGPLNSRQVEEIIDPQLRARRSVAMHKVQAESSSSDEQLKPVAAPLNPPGVGPVLLTIQEVSKLTTRSKSTIYQAEKDGTFPQRLKLGSSSRWKKDEVIAWIEEKAAGRESS